MTFSALRVAQGMILSRVLEVGDSIPVVESTTDFTVSSGTHTITKPTGTVENDLLLLFFGISGNEGDPTPITAPGDSVPWVKELEGGPTNLTTFATIFYKIAGASEPASYAFTSGFTPTSASIMYRISGVDTTVPIISSQISTQRLNGAIGGNSDADAPLVGIITTRTNCLLLHHLSVDRSNFGPDNTAEPGGSETVILKHNHGGTIGVTHAAAWENFAPGGGTGERVWTIVDLTPGLFPRITHLVAVQPPIV